MRACAIGLTLFAVCLAGCADEGAGILIKIDGALSPDRVRLDAAAGGRSRSYDFMPKSLPFTVLLQVPRNVRGRMDLTATAFLGATTLAEVTDHLDLVAGAVQQLTLTLPPGGQPDMPATEPDLGGADLVQDLVGVDLLTPEDLVGADLVPPPDLTQPCLVILPAGYDFDAVNEGTVTSSVTFKMQNTGDATATIAASLTGADADQFKIDSDDCTGFAQNHNDKCMVSVSFHPQNAGVRNVTLQINDGIRCGAVALTGRAVGINSKSCSVDADCQSDHCTDGHCCDEAATTCKDCRACNVAGKEGTCSNVPAGLDPHTFCTQKCADGCDNAGACRAAAATRVCQTDACSNVTLMAGQWTTANTGEHHCDGATLDCPSALSGTCAGSLVCSDTTMQCKPSCTTDADCVYGTYCSPSSTCQPSSTTINSACSSPAQCAAPLACISGTCQCGHLGQAVCTATRPCTDPWTQYGVGAVCVACGGSGQVSCGGWCKSAGEAPDPNQGYKCVACGQPGQQPCNSGCANGGCYNGGSCVANGDPCYGGTCNNGSCSGCGGPTQPCCGSYCSKLHVYCDFDASNHCKASCGGNGEWACWNSSCGAGLIAIGLTCVPCGATGQPCCPTNVCNSGSCQPDGNCP